ncbi:peptidase U32 family protein [Alteribacter aurantiacus]|uniref:peptidase U32 family protein n=1 Tax=Alteribacter aurantiacus TaxID=254410 RepID=UPI0004054079|nr:peptidase U32 family protein [Alteribacter aurantiacus]
MHKPELLVTPTCVEDIEPLVKAGADAFMIGEQRFGLRLAGEFDRNQITQAVHTAHEGGARVYVAVNALFHNDMLPALPDYLTFLADAKVDAVVFGDPGVLMIAREAAPDLPLFWSTETTATNWYSANYWGRKGASRAVLARELNLDSVVEIKEHAEVPIEVHVHGMTCMFQSKRTLLGNYMEFQGKDLKVEGRRKDRNLFLFDPERDYKYPIWEDRNGTHIMSPKDVCMIDELDELMDAQIDSFKIDGLLKDSVYLIAVTKLYREALNLYAEDPDLYFDKKEELLEQVKKVQPKDRSIDTGFFFKETVF